MDKASTKSDENTNGSPKIPKEGELVGKLGTKMETVPQLWTKPVGNLLRILTAGQKFIKKLNRLGNWALQQRLYLHVWIMPVSIPMRIVMGTQKFLKKVKTLVN